MPFISSSRCRHRPTRWQCNAPRAHLRAVNFPPHQYAMVLHTFETDPDPNPSRHPHVHLTIKTAGLDGTRLNPRKPDIQRWREGFAEALREQGIEATTTSRLHRTTHERWTIRRGVDQVTQAKQIDRRTRRRRCRVCIREVMQNYERVMKALAGSDRGDDRQLAADLVGYLTGRSRVAEKEKGRPQEREMILHSTPTTLLCSNGLASGVLMPGY